jgi:hypothetical protein
MLSFLFAVPRGTHHPYTHPSIHASTHPAFCVYVSGKGVGFLFWHSGFIKHDGSCKPKLFAPWSGCTWFLWFCSKLILFLGVHQQTCSIQSTSWWILGLVESSLCFGYAFVLVAELFGGRNALACVPSHSKFLWQATRRYIYWNLRSLGIQRTLAAHNPGSGYCNNWQSAAFTATNKLQYNSAVCGGRKAKNQWISTPVVVATGHVIHAILDSYSWGKKSHEEEAWCVCSTVEFMQVN